jgi:hypothetical protein
LPSECEAAPAEEGEGVTPDPHDLYREQARKVLAKITEASVENAAHVKRVPGGAYVECVLWIPEKANAKA